MISFKVVMSATAVVFNSFEFVHGSVSSADGMLSRAKVMQYADKIRVGEMSATDLQNELPEKQTTQVIRFLSIANQSIKAVNSNVTSRDIFGLRSGVFIQKNRPSKSKIKRSPGFLEIVKMVDKRFFSWDCFAGVLWDHYNQPHVLAESDNNELQRALGLEKLGLLSPDKEFSTAHRGKIEDAMFSNYRNLELASNVQCIEHLFKDIRSINARAGRVVRNINDELQDVRKVTERLLQQSASNPVRKKSPSHSENSTNGGYNTPATSHTFSNGGSGSQNSGSSNAPSRPRSSQQGPRNRDGAQPRPRTRARASSSTTRKRFIGHSNEPASPRRSRPPPRTRERSWTQGAIPYRGPSRNSPKRVPPGSPRRPMSKQTRPRPRSSSYAQPPRRFQPATRPSWAPAPRDYSDLSQGGIETMKRIDEMQRRTNDKLNQL